MLGVDPRLLESFVVLGEELHFTRAAERLHVAQPALSQQIARLERQIGTVLFTRAPVALTPAGAALLERVRPALRELGQAVEDARRSDGRVTLRLGHLSSFGSVAVPALVAALRERRSGVELIAREHSVEEQLAGLHARTLDVGLFYLDPTVELDHGSLTLEPIASGPHYVALPPSHRLAASAAVALEELAGEPWIGPAGTGVPGYQARFFAALCERHRFTPTIVAQANSVETMLGMVSAGLGIAPIPWTTRLPAELVFVDTPGETFDVVAAVRDPDEELVEIARDVLGRLALSRAAPTAQ